jgi:hypothetical protein
LSHPSYGQEHPFKPSYFVAVRTDEADMDPETFWVKEDQLFVGRDAHQLSPYREQDYVLYKIARLEARNDYTTFPFHRDWEAARDQIWQGEKDGAVENYQHLIAELRRSPDFIPSHVNKLSAMYRAEFQKELKTYEQEQDPTISIEASGESSFQKTIDGAARRGARRQGVRAMEKSKEFFREKARARERTSGPGRLTEADIQAALESPVLNDPAVRSVDPGVFSAALSLETPIPRVTIRTADAHTHVDPLVL